jgi:hypothetical protein
VNRRGRVVEAGRPTTVKGAIFAEFERALTHPEVGDSHDQVGLVGRPVSQQKRFWVKVALLTQGGCWEWLAYRDRKGYGVFGRQRAHRVAYELLVGPIPDGLQIDHLCRNPSCVNPDHLEPVTLVENTRRGIAWQVAGAKNAAKTHCPTGHPYDDANTLILSRGRRDCRTCQRSGARKTQRSKTHCPQGHEYTPENTFMDSGKWRRCLTCRRARDLRRAVTPKAPAAVALESPPPLGTTPRRRNLAPRLERGGAALTNRA